MLYAANDAYPKLAGISLVSYLKHNQDTTGLAVWILSDGIGPENTAKLRSIADKAGCDLVIFDITAKLKTLVADHVTGYANAVDKGMTAYGRLFLSEILLPDTERAVYLDCDTLVTGSLDGLWNFDLKNKPLGFVCDCLRNEYKGVIGYPLEERYFNSGVMLIDFSTWCARGCEEKIRNHIRTVRADYPLVDQDILNLSLKGEITPLPPKFNFLSQLFLYEYPAYARVYHLYPGNWFSSEEYAEAKAAPAICHFCGQTFGRPWFRNSRHPMKAVYDRAAAASPWAGEPQPAGNLAFPYRVQLFAWRFLPVFFAAWLGALMQDVFMRREYGVLMRTAICYTALQTKRQGHLP